jgi:hypothetical protein
LALNPDNEKARAALERLGSGAEILRQTTAPSAGEFEPAVRETERVQTRPPGQAAAAGYARPAQRGQTKGTWTSERRESNRLGFYVLGGLAVGLIAVSLILLVFTLSDEDAQDGTPTPAQAVAATPIPLTPTNTPRRPLYTGVTGTVPPNILPPTWTASPTSTLPPSPTWTPVLPGRENYVLIFAGYLQAGDPFGLYVVQADGGGLERLSLELPDLEAAPDQPTLTPAAEAEQEATPEGEPPTPAPPAAESGRIELLDPAFSPDGQFIAFTGQVGDTQELFVVEYPSGTPRQITRLGASHTSGAAWSPDGASLLFFSDDDGDYDIYRVSPAEDTPPVNLTTNEGIDDRDPAWSPDGRYIAFASDREAKGAFEIFVIPLENSTQVCQLTDSANSSFSPAWSPDGSQIAFISNRNLDNDLFVMRADGSNETVLSVADGDWQEREPAWAANGRWLVVSSNREDSPSAQLWVVSPDGREWNRLETDLDEARDAAWLRSGDALVPPPDFEFRCTQ